MKTHLPQLTERQQQCLRGFLARKTAKQIGRELGITHHAVEQHMKAARKKLGAGDTAEAARIYFGSADATVEPYYGMSEVSVTGGNEAFSSTPKRGTSLLRDIATDEPGMIQTLSTRQTLMAIGLCSVGLITVLALIVAVAEGVAELAR